MTAKQLKLVAILLGLAVLLYLPRLFRDDGAGGSLEMGSGFAFAMADSVTRVDIVQADGTDTIRLEQGVDGWSVDGYMADEAKLAELLGVLGDLSSTELVARNPSNHAALGVEDSGRRIYVYAGGRGPVGFHLGERDPQTRGYFVRTLGEAIVYRLDGQAGGYLSRERDTWRPRQIAAVDTTAVREIVVRRGDREAVVRRAEEGWMIADAPADSGAVASVLAALSRLSLTGFPTEDEEEAADFLLADASLDVFSTAEGDVTGRRLVLGLRFLEDEDRGDWLVRRADGSEVYRLAQFTMNRVLPEALIP